MLAKSKSVLVAAFLLGCALPAHAGSICGQITDLQSGLPVAQAGVFLRDAQGAYLGQVAATDATGNYCLDGLAPGFYTLEVKVDDYLTVFSTNIEVLDTTSSLPITLEWPGLLLDLPWPNPASARVNLRLHAGQAADLDLVVHDLRGRVIRRWQGNLAQGSHELIWDGRDTSGRQAPAGLYFIRLRTAVEDLSRPVLLTR